MFALDRRHLCKQSWVVQQPTTGLLLRRYNGSSFGKLKSAVRIEINHGFVKRFRLCGLEDVA